MAKYHISSKAKEDLDNIWLYTNEYWSLQQADKKFKEILKQIEFLSNNKNIGKSFEYIRNGLKGMLVNPHIIFYRTNSKEEIEILRILHQNMNLEEQL